VISLAIGATLGLALTGSAVAHEENRNGRDCSNATLRGSYMTSNTIFVYPGVSGPSPTPPATAITSVAYVTMYYFDGNGSFTTRSTANLGQDATFTGSYSIDSNCHGTYTADLPEQPKFVIEISPKGDAYVYVGISPFGATANRSERVSMNNLVAP
jgi:hypothetical protein